MFSKNNKYWHSLHTEFSRCLQQPEELIKSRNIMQFSLNAFNRRAYPLNGTYTCLTDVLEIFLQLDTPIASINRQCLQCKDIKMCQQLYSLFRTSSGVIQDDQIITAIQNRREVSSQLWHNYLTGQNITCLQCPTCKTLLIDSFVFLVVPSVCVIDLPNSPINTLSTTLIVKENTEEQIKLRISGIIYYNEQQRHFISRIISKSGQVWFHDGIKTGSLCQRKGQLQPLIQGH